MKLYVITDEFLIRDEELEISVEKAIEGGAKIVQLRDKFLPFDKKLERAKRLKKITKKYKVPLIINDDVVLAKEVNADGVHLGEDEDYYFQFAREMLGNKIIGVSCYGDLERAIKFERMGASYVAFGSVFSSKTKRREVLKTLKIFQWAKSLLRVPIVAIGGINHNNYKILLEFGVDIIAVISAIFEGNPYLNAKRFNQ